MKVTLMSFTPGMEELCGFAAAKCTNSKRPDSALKHSVESGHDSVLEHAVFTFDIDGISRACLAQLTRHRLASFSVQSQRYVKLDENIQLVAAGSAVAEGDFRFQRIRLAVVDGVRDGFHPRRELREDIHSGLREASVRLRTDVQQVVRVARREHGELVGDGFRRFPVRVLYLEAPCVVQRDGRFRREIQIAFRQLVVSHASVIAQVVANTAVDETPRLQSSH